MSSKKKTSKKSAKETVEETATDEHVTESSGFSFDSIGSAHDEIQEESSAPNENAIAAQETAQVEIAKEQSGNVDSEGTVFNPELHAVNKDGEPSVTPKGKFRKRRGVSTVATTNKALAEQQAEAAVRQQQEAVAGLMVDTTTQCLSMLISDEWKAEPDESVALKSATTAVLIDKDVKDFPPMAALVAVVTAYATKRIVEGEQTQSKIGRAKYWLSEKWKARKNRSKKNASQSNRGNDGKRENDDSEETVQTVESTGTRHPRT